MKTAKNEIAKSFGSFDPRYYAPFDFLAPMAPSHEGAHSCAKCDELKQRLVNAKNKVKESTNLFFENLMSYEQAAQYLGISEAYLRRLKARGAIPFVPMGRRGIRFNLKSLKEWVEKREIK